jgi:hypothetical protein
MRTGKRSYQQHETRHRSYPDRQCHEVTRILLFFWLHDRIFILPGNYYYEDVHEHRKLFEHTKIGWRKKTGDNWHHHQPDQLGQRSTCHQGQHIPGELRIKINPGFAKKFFQAKKS